MAIIGFNFTKLNCERKKSDATGNIEIKHHISIKSVEKADVNLGSAKSEAIKIGFSFDVIYGSGLGAIAVEGDVMFSDTKEIVTETLKGYKADKKLNATVANEVNKFIYAKSIIKALSMSDSTNLPAPIPIVPRPLKNAK